MAFKSSLPESIRKQAASTAISTLRQEAASFQLKGQTINPHQLVNAETSLLNIFSYATDTEDAADNVKNSCFRSHSDPALARAYNYGATAGLGILESNLDEKSPKRDLPVARPA